MPHVIPSSNKQEHTLNMNCKCEPEIVFINNDPIIIHKDENDQVTVTVHPDEYYDKPRKKRDKDNNQNY